METQKRLHENLSALVDGELAASEVELAFASLETPEGRAARNAYQQIGHTLRSDRCGYDLSDGFGARLAARLAAETPIRNPAVRKSGSRPNGGADSDIPAPAAATTFP